MTWRAGRRVWRTGAGLAIFIGCIAILQQAAWASEQTEPAAAQATVGSLPLMAALGIGIAVAIGAVIAFLQMTDKGRDQRQAAHWNAAESASASESDEPDVPQAMEEPTGYTIPLNLVLDEQGSAEAGVEGQPRLCGVQGEFAGASFRLNGRGLSIGRDPAICSVVFPVNVGEVSRRHCTLQFEVGRRLFVLEDHGSSNGTFLPGGQRLEPGKRYELRSGDRFALSGTVHWFEVRE